MDVWMGLGRRGLVTLLLLLASFAYRLEHPPDFTVVFVPNYTSWDQKQQQEDRGPRRWTCSGTGVQTRRCVISRVTRVVDNHDLQISSMNNFNYCICNPLTGLLKGF